MMPKDLKEFLRACNDQGVKYLIVGGYALGVYSEPRATKDLDVFIRSDRENSEAIFRALAQFGAPLEGLSPADFRDSSTFQIGQPPSRIDILQTISGISFDEAWPNRVSGSVDGEVEAFVIARDDLILNKSKAGRERDLLDVKALQKSPKAAKQ